MKGWKHWRSGEEEEKEGDESSEGEEETELGECSKQCEVKILRLKPPSLMTTNTSEEEEEADCMRMQELAEEMKSYTESRQDGGGLLCQICASTPCRCALRRVEERLESLYSEKRKREERDTKEENETFRSVSYDKKLTSCQEQIGTRNRKRKLSKEELTGTNKASKLIPNTTQ